MKFTQFSMLLDRFYKMTLDERKAYYEELKQRVAKMEKIEDSEELLLEMDVLEGLLSEMPNE